MLEKTKKADFLDFLGQAILRHPYMAGLVIILLEIAVLAALMQLSGCAGQKFADGDRTAYNPADYEVTEPGMAKPEPD